jgi:hypothetical protein
MSSFNPLGGYGVGPGGWVGGQRVTDWGGRTWVGDQPFSRYGNLGYLGNDRISDYGSRTYVGDQPITKYGGSNYLGDQRIIPPK